MKQARLIAFVCSQNTCRSVYAEAVLRYLVEQTQVPAQVSSMGVHASPGAACEKMTMEVAKMRGYDVAEHSSLLLHPQDFEKHDDLIALDRNTLTTLREQASSNHQNKIYLLSKYQQFFTSVDEILYPSKPHLKAFEKMFDCIEDACLGLFHHLKQSFKEE
ncbi:MAG: hypothetical protein ACNYNY_02705 [Candidatus Oxydemutatoraceae bacterium WSBS_2016_MAG_OTU14]